MKQLTALAFCLFATGAIFAQATKSQSKTTTVRTTTTTTTHGTHTITKRARVKVAGPGVAGFILDAHRHPVPDVEAFVYAPDSSIVASGYTDDKGHYETNTVAPGNYMVKIVYPSSKIIEITGVVIKGRQSLISITAAPPEADTTLPYTNFAPVVVKKKGAKRH